MASNRLRFNISQVILAAGIVSLVGIFIFPSGGESDSVLPAEKQAIVDREIKALSDALGAPTAPYRGPPASGASPVGVDTGVPAGPGKIYDGPGPFSSEAYHFLNSWRATAGPNTLMIFAGSDGQDKGQGVLLVLLQRPNRSYIPEETCRYETPLRVGPVRIVDANDMVITVRADDGTTFEFDPNSAKLLLVSAPTTIAHQ